MFTLCSVGEYGWLIKGQFTVDVYNDNDSLPSQKMMLAKMITGLGLGQLPRIQSQQLSQLYSVVYSTS